jgi:hypothetical protein
MSAYNSHQLISTHLKGSAGGPPRRLWKAPSTGYNESLIQNQQSSAALTTYEERRGHQDSVRQNCLLEPPRAFNISSSDSDSEILDRALRFTTEAPPPYESIAPLSRPLAVPQVIHGRGNPFSRIWAPELQNHGITEREFLEFIDNLNVVATANPPLQILGLVGGVLGNVPHHWVQLAGLAVRTTAAVGTAAVTKGRTERFMIRVNNDYFGPRGLKATISSSEAMRHALGLPEHEPLLAPLFNGNKQMSTQERKLNAVRPYIMAITLDVPPPSEQTTVLAKMSARQVQRQLKSYEKKAQKDRQKFLMESERDPATGSPVHYTQRKKYLKESNKLDKEVEKINRKAEKELFEGKDHPDKIECERAKELRKVDKERKKLDKEEKEESDDDKEAKKAPKTLWILIENLDYSQ